MKSYLHEVTSSLISSNSPDDRGEAGILAALEHDSSTRTDGRLALSSRRALAKMVLVSTLFIIGAVYAYLKMHEPSSPQETIEEMAMRHSQPGRATPDIEADVISQVAPRSQETAAHIENVVSDGSPPGPDHGVRSDNDGASRTLSDLVVRELQASEPPQRRPSQEERASSVSLSARSAEKPASKLESRTGIRTERQSNTDRQKNLEGSIGKTHHDVDEDILAALLMRMKPGEKR